MSVCTIRTQYDYRSCLERSEPSCAELIDIAELHRDAPGALGAIFSGDGSFEGAPPFICWLWDGRIYLHVDVAALAFCAGPDGSVVMSERGRHTQVGPYYLDVRIPSVATRLWHLLVALPQVPYHHPDTMRLISAIHSGDALNIRIYAAHLARLFRTWAPEIAHRHVARHRSRQLGCDAESIPG